MRILLFVFTRWRVVGKENVPRHGPLLVVANHVAAADPPLVGVSLGRKVMFMAKEELFRSRVSGYFVRSFGSFPIRRGRVDKTALREADKLLAQGLALAMFPEGKRSRNAQLQPAFSGSALIASHRSVPILPVGIIGTEKTKRLAWLLRRPEITVNIGPPFQLPSSGNNINKAELARLTNFIMERIAELLPSDYQGNYKG